MQGIKTDLYVFKYLLDLKYPAITVHLQRLQVDVQSFITSWFLCLFTTTFSLEDSQSFFDIFLNEGDKMLFRFALAFFQVNMDRIIKMKHSEQVFLFIRDIATTAEFDQLKTVMILTTQLHLFFGLPICSYLTDDFFPFPYRWPSQSK